MTGIQSTIKKLGRHIIARSKEEAMEKYQASKLELLNSEATNNAIEYEISKDDENQQVSALINSKEDCRKILNMIAEESWGNLENKMALNQVCDMSAAARKVYTKDDFNKLSKDSGYTADYESWSLAQLEGDWNGDDLRDTNKQKEINQAIVSEILDQEDYQEITRVMASLLLAKDSIKKVIGNDS